MKKRKTMTAKEIVVNPFYRNERKTMIFDYRTDNIPTAKGGEVQCKINTDKKIESLEFALDGVVQKENEQYTLFREEKIIRLNGFELDKGEKIIIII